MVADFAVTVAVDAAGVSNDQLDYLTLQSNQVENSYRKVKEPPTVAYAISEVKSIVTEALHENEPESGETMTAELPCTAAVTVIYFLLQIYLIGMAVKSLGKVLAEGAVRGQTSKCHIK